MLEHVSSFKLLGVYMAEDLTWAVHCDFRKPTEDCTRSGRSGAAVPASDTILVYTSPHAKSLAVTTCQNSAAVDHLLGFSWRLSGLKLVIDYILSFPTSLPYVSMNQLHTS